jgi:serine/threonine protein phosphatase PrpC
MDGHGIYGRQVSALLEDELGPTFLKRLLEKDSTVDVALATAAAETVAALRRSPIDARESGSTAVLCTHDALHLLVANVGDSRCVLGQRDGNHWKAIPLSRDHKPSDEEERKRILRAGGFVEPTRVRGWGFQGPARVWRQKQTVSSHRNQHALFPLDASYPAGTKSPWRRRMVTAHCLVGSRTVAWLWRVPLGTPT